MEKNTLFTQESLLSILLSGNKMINLFIRTPLLIEDIMAGENSQRKFPKHLEECFTKLRTSIRKEEYSEEEHTAETIVEMPGCAPSVLVKDKPSSYSICKQCGTSVNDRLFRCWRCKNKIK
jgi:hypothetical protein